MINEKVCKSEVYTWGFGKTGALGTGKEISENIPILIKIDNNVKMISSGLHTSMCLLDNGEIYAFGCNKDVRIGLGSFQESFIPKKILLSRKIIIISCGKKNSLAIDNQNIGYSTGFNKSGELGLGHASNTENFTQIQGINNLAQVSAGSISLYLTQTNQLFVSGKGSLNGCADAKNKLTPTQILINETIISISTGFIHSACVNDKGEVFTWGIGSDYQLGHGNKSNQQQPKKIENFSAFIKQVSCTVGEKHAHSGCVDTEGRVFTWGNGYKAKLGHNDTDDYSIPKLIEALINIKVSKIMCGGIHSAVLTEDGKVFTFGCGSDGRLGHKESEKYNVLYKESLPREIEVFSGKNVIDLSCSYYHCIALSN